MKRYTVNDFQRITKADALKRYLNGGAVYACPVKMRPGAPWYPEISLTLYEDVKRTREEFTRMINSISFYNCSHETGLYLAYYIDEKEGN